MKNVNFGKLVTWVIILLFCFAFLGSCFSDVGGSCYSGSRSTATCKYCGRSYSAGDSAGNFKNIARSGLCNNCYNNYKSATKALGK